MWRNTDKGSCTDPRRRGKKKQKKKQRNKRLEREIKEDPVQASTSIHVPARRTEGVGRTRRQQIPIEFYISDEEN